MLNYFLVVSMVLIGFVPMLVEMRKRKFDLFNLKNTFILYYVVQLGISGVVTLSSGVASEIGLDPIGYEGRYTQALLLSTFGLLLFQIGYYSRTSRSIIIPRLVKLRWHPRNYRKLTAVFFLLGFLAFFLLLQLNGGLSTFLANREAFRAGEMSGQGFLIFPATSLLALAALVYFAGSINEMSRNKKTWIRPALVLLLAIAPAFFLGFRSLLFLPVLQFIVVWHYGYKRIPPKLIFTSIIVLGFSFTLYGLSREVPAGISLSTELALQIIESKPEIAYAVISRSKGTEVVASVINTLDQTGDYDMGWRGLVEAITIVIPRSIWEDKPSPSSQRFTTYFFGNALSSSRGYDMDAWGGISPTVVGELYWHFGAVGVAIGLFCLGRLAKLSFSTLRANPGNPAVVIIYAIFFTSFSMFAEAIQGYLNSLIMHIPIVIISLIYLTVRVRRRRKQGPQAVSLEPTPQ